MKTNEVQIGQQIAIGDDVFIVTEVTFESDGRIKMKIEGMQQPSPVSLEELEDTSETMLHEPRPPLDVRGLHPWPGHVPAPLDGYEYVIDGVMIYSRQPCAPWLRRLFRLPERLAWFIYKLIP